jgi:hypothetical protein
MAMKLKSEKDPFGSDGKDASVLGCIIKASFY